MGGVHSREDEIESRNIRDKVEEVKYRGVVPSLPLNTIRDEVNKLNYGEERSVYRMVRYRIKLYLSVEIYMQIR